jgi:cytochrome b561
MYREMLKRRTYTGQFTLTAKWLHWLVAMLMISVLSVAWSFAFVAPEDRAEAIPVHVSIGVIVVLLTLIRLAWRKASPPPPIPPATPGWIQRGASVGHFLLYGLILLQGVLGLWMAALSPVGIRFFNMFNLSELSEASAGSIIALRQVHFAVACLLTATVVAHVAAALWHHFVLRDDVLIRMLPFSGFWQKLNQPERDRAERFPSTQFENWPKRLPKREAKL